MPTYAAPVTSGADGLPSSGQRIAAARLALGLTQSQLADLIHSSRGTVAVWETKDRVPEGDVLLRLAQSLNVNPAWLMMMSDNPMQPEEVTPDESKVLRTFRNLTQENQDQIASQVEFLLGRQEARPPRQVTRHTTRVTTKTGK
jgi:transcriptional regulator with XRE-family HTH domain